ncbi:hypothetical protein DPEC_G00285100 [Dallia pectoralis]|uniref:Uncharacterized protein n=1 Tax=Dallia pectoralis TaxID=75939 RepID=A0ACC2FJM8_DALPE|nr:hypothetical protein DPEC_G00285100 [Dallia pectoralis]
MECSPSLERGRFGFIKLHLAKWTDRARTHRSLTPGAGGLVLGTSWHYGDLARSPHARRTCPSSLRDIAKHY